MPRKCNPDLTFEFKNNRLDIRRYGRPVYKITVWPRPRAEARDNSGCWQRAYPAFRVIDYPPKKTKAKPPSPQIELELCLPEQPQAMTKKEAYDLPRQSMPFPYAIALAPFQSHQ